jgi:hypothetical protein
LKDEAEDVKEAKESKQARQATEVKEKAVASDVISSITNHAISSPNTEP